MRRFAVAFIVGLLTFGPTAHAAPLQQQLASFAQSIGPEDFAFRRTMRVERSDGGDSKSQILVETFDPTRPTAERWKLISVDDRAPTADEARDIAKARAREIVPTYGRVALYIGSTTAVAQPSTNGRAMLGFDRLPKGVVMVGKKDISADTSARVTIVNGDAMPWVEKVEFESTKPISMMLVAKINSFNAVTKFRLMPDGRPVPFEQIMTMSGAMMGRAGTIRTTISFDDHRPVRR